jgi:hypothetical protein
MVRFSVFRCKPGRKGELGLGFGFGPGKRSPIEFFLVPPFSMKENQSLSMGVI